MTHTAIDQLFSGAQPSNQATLGNYLGAIQHWVRLQDQTTRPPLFAIMDLHSLSGEMAPDTLAERTLDMAALYLACGLDPDRSTIFVQSHVAAHSQLAWILNCLTPMGDLQRMTQFKSKSQSQKHNINVGLLTYPTLMAADILLYQATHVPVGDDQKQHLELSRDIAQRLNNRWGETLVTVPEPLIFKDSARVMALQDPARKMSKSDANSHNTLFMLDDPKTIEKRILRAVTDSECRIAIDEARPGISNLVRLFAAVTEQTCTEVTDQFQQARGYGDFKKALAAAVISKLEPIQQRYHTLRADVGALQQVLNQGAQQARAIANPCLQRIHDALGLYHGNA